jgi:hypothetical protein
MEAMVEKVRSSGLEGGELLSKFDSWVHVGQEKVPGISSSNNF